MKITIHYEGNTYESPTTDEDTAENVVETFYGMIDNIDKFKMGMKDGGYLLLGPEAARRCAIIVTD